MQDLYKILKPVFTSETMTSAIRQAGLVRQKHLAAGIRKDPPSAEFGYSVLRAHHAFMESLCKAFHEEKVSDDIAETLGFHSLMFFGINPRLFEIAVLAVSGAEEYSLEHLADIMKEMADVDAILRGDADPVDTLRWLSHTGTSFATYLVKCSR
jgi:hypothetical protein